MELIVFWIIMAIICGMVASSKNRSFFAYFLGGLFVWPIVLVAAILAKPRADGPSPEAVAGAQWRAQQLPHGAPPSPARADAVGSTAPFRADGMIGRYPFRAAGDSVILLMEGREVAFASRAAAVQALGLPAEPHER
ncbi:hypothetical protein [Microcystis phage vB_MweS-yong2]|nr:hypothetical protein [Microcystis phage vB_MweS-yong2]